MRLSLAVNYLYMPRHRRLLGKTFAADIAYYTTAFSGDTADLPAISRRTATVGHLASAKTKWRLFLSCYFGS